MRRAWLCLILPVALMTGCSRSPVVDTTAGHLSLSSSPPGTNSLSPMAPKISKSDSEWRKELSPEQYEVLRQKGTERAFTGKYWNHKEQGVYRCAGCRLELFQSDTKYDSGCGWPSYYAPAQANVVTTQQDLSHGMDRIEVLCSRCGGHLGHVFEDGPQPTGLRYCINSASLEFEKKPAAPPSPGTNSPSPTRK